MTPYQKRQVGDLQILELPGDPHQGTIILLHGFGADAYDLLPLHSMCDGPTWIFPQGFLEIPIAPGYMGKAWFPVDVEKLTKAVRENRLDEVDKAFPAGIDEACRVIDDLLVRMGVHRSKVILGGFSQGAVLAIETAFHAAQRCAGLLIFSGTLVNAPMWTKLAPLHAKTPFFQSHGMHDPILPFQKAEELEKLLINSGLQGKLYSFAGGHEIPTTTLHACSTFLKHHLGQK